MLCHSVAKEVERIAVISCNGTTAPTASSHFRCLVNQRSPFRVGGVRYISVPKLKVLHSKQSWNYPSRHTSYQSTSQALRLTKLTVFHALRPLGKPLGDYLLAFVGRDTSATIEVMSEKRDLICYGTCSLHLYVHF